MQRLRRLFSALGGFGVYGGFLFFFSAGEAEVSEYRCHGDASGETRERESGRVAILNGAGAASLPLLSFKAQICLPFVAWENEKKRGSDREAVSFPDFVPAHLG